MSTATERDKHWAGVAAKHPELNDLLAPKLSRYIPVQPTPPQAAFLLLPQLEALYGGAAGGGKSIALLMGALQYVDVPGYAAILFRRSYTDLALPGALMDVAHQWLTGTDAHWNFNEKQWTFPSGATLTFAYLARDADKYRYQGSAFQYIAFDELTQFEASTYTYLFSRLRKPTTLKVPLRMRSATNPGGFGHDWVHARFIDKDKDPTRIFIPARLIDNPYLDREQYETSLANLEALERAQLLAGDWDIRPQGKMFRRDWFRFTSKVPPGIRWIRFWDLSVRRDAESDSDWTAGALVGLHEGNIYIKHIAHMQGTPGAVEEFIKATAAVDGRGVEILMEQEGGSSGLTVVDHYKDVLKRYQFKGVRPKGKKEIRATVWSPFVQEGKCYLIPGEWDMAGFINECEQFPTKKVHDDRVDSVSGAVTELLQEPEPKIRVIQQFQKTTREREVSLGVRRPRQGWSSW